MQAVHTVQLLVTFNQIYIGRVFWASSSLTIKFLKSLTNRKQLFQNFIWYLISQFYFFCDVFSSIKAFKRFMSSSALAALFNPLIWLQMLNLFDKTIKMRNVETNFESTIKYLSSFSAFKFRKLSQLWFSSFYLTCICSVATASRRSCS